MSIASRIWRLTARTDSAKATSQSIWTASRNEHSSRHRVARLRILEVLAERRIQAVAKAQELDRVNRALGKSLLHLDPAGAALGRSDLDVSVLEPAQQSSAGPERHPELVTSQAVGPAHARAASVDELDVQFGNLADELQSGQADVQSPEMAGLVVARTRMQRLVRLGQLAACVESREILAKIERVLGHELGVKIVGQLDVLLAK